MRRGRSRAEVRLRPGDAPPPRAARASGSLIVFLAVSVAVVALAWLAGVRPEGAAVGSGSADSILMTLGDEDRPADWDAFFARHPLPDDAIRRRIRAANDDVPGDVICVPLEAATTDVGCP